MGHFQTFAMIKRASMAIEDCIHLRTLGLLQHGLTKSAAGLRHLSVEQTCSGRVAGLVIDDAEVCVTGVRLVEEYRCCTSGPNF